MTRSITLSKNLTVDIFNTCQHFIDYQDRELSQDYEELRDMADCSNRFKLTVTIEERIPKTADIMLNVFVQHILTINDCNEDDTEEMNAFYQYLEHNWNFNGENHPYLLKATTPEALEYCIPLVINWMGGDA